MREVNMQQDTQFIKNIAKLIAPAELQARIAELQGAFQSGTALNLATALVGVGADNHPLIKQLNVIQILQEHMIRNHATDDKEAFVCFLNPSKAASMLEKATAEVAEYRRALDRNASLPRAEGVDSSEDEQVNEHDASARMLLNPRVASPTHVASPGRGRSVFAVIREFVTSPTPSASYVDAQRTVAAIESLALLGDNLAQCRQVLDAAIERYPATLRSQSAVKSLDNFSQFLIFLMEDALQQLHALLQYPQYERFLAEGEYQLFIASLAPLFKKYAVNSNYLPSNQLIAALNSKQSVSQFLNSLEGQDRALAVQGSFVDSQVTSQRMVRSGSRDQGIVRTQQHPNRMEMVEEDEFHTTTSSSSPVVSSPVPSVERAVYPLPAYLARSLMDKLADAIAATADKLSRSSVRDTLFNVDGTVKASKMTGVANALRQHLPLPTLREIYQIRFNDETLQAILHEKRGRYESGAFSKTLATAGREFLAENPASLMRQYVFLTQLVAAADFTNALNQPIHAQHLSNTITKMNALRKAMKHFYPTDRSLVLSVTIKEYMWQLIDLAEEHPDVAIHVRVLLVAYLDTLSEGDFNRHKRIKRWLLGDHSTLNLLLSDKETVLNAVARNIEQDPLVVGHQDDGIRAWERALFEITAFQQDQYDDAYTSQDHHVKIESVLFPLSVSLNKYFGKTSLSQDASVTNLELFNENPHYEAVAVANPRGYFVGAGKDKGYTTNLRLSTNLAAYWQAALASSVNVDFVIATTFAIVNSGDVDALEQWETDLIAIETASIDVQVNTWMLNSMRNEQKEIDGEKEIYGVATFESIAHLKDFSQKEQRYQAILSFATALLQHVKMDQSKSTTIRNALVRLCCVVERHIEMLKHTIENEAIVVRKVFQHDLHLKEYQRYIEEGQSQEVAEENARFSANKLDYCMTPADLVQLGAPAQPLVDLENRIKEFNDNLAAICYSASASESVVAIRTEIYGEHVYNPHVGIAFESEFTRAITEKRDSFFIDALFRSEHHPMEEATIHAMCKRIADALPDYLTQAWHSLSMRFYGNSQALSDLASYYITQGTHGTQSGTKKALKIAMFGFSNQHFSADKQAFAQLILQVFAAERTITPQSHVKKLQEAMEFLASHPHRVLAEERRALATLAAVVRTAEEDVEDDYDALDLYAQQQAAVYNEEAQTVMGLSVEFAEYARQYRRAHTGHVENLNQPTPQRSVVNSGVSGAVSAKIRTKALLAALVKSAFPKDYRYYNALASATAYKYERDEDSSPDPLIGVLWQQIVAVKAELKCKDIDSMVLETAINDLRGVSRKVRNSEGTWVNVQQQNLLFIYPRFVSVNAIDKTGLEAEQRKGRVQPLALAAIVAQKDRFGDHNLPLTHFAKEFHGLVLETKGALLQMEIPTGVAASHTQSTSVVVEPRIISDEEIRIAYQKDIDQLVLKTVKVLLTENPTDDSFSDEDRAILGVREIDQDRTINVYQERVKNLNIGNSFKRRVRLIRDKQYDRCLNDIFTHRAVENGQRISEDAELTNFITKLKRKADVEKLATSYQQYFDDFIWALAEKDALTANAAGYFHDDSSNRFLELLKHKHYLDWDYLIALGCQHYVAMSKHARATEKGQNLLSALKYLAKPLTQILSNEVYHEINTLLVGLMNTLDQSLSNAKKLSVVRARIREYLHHVKGKKVNRSELSDLELQLLTHFKDDDEREKQNQPRRDYAAFFPGVALKQFNPQVGKGIDIYGDIYSLVQASSRVSQSLEKDTGRQLHQLELDHSADDSVILAVDTPSKARALLNRLHTLLRDNEKFATWHRDSLVMGKKFPSSLDVLMRHVPHQSETLDALHKDDRSNSILKHLRAINSHSYYWENIYGVDTDYSDQAAYVALAIYELEQLMQMDKLVNVQFKTTYVSESRETIEHIQHNHVIEQMGLIFLAAKHFYQDKGYDEKNAFKVISAPFTQALLDMADARGCNAESIIVALLAKACDSFNMMLNPKGADNIEDYNDSYKLAITENSALRLEMEKWIKSTSGIRAVYVNQTLLSGIHCEEQAAFVLDLYVNPSQDNVPMRHRSVSSEGAITENIVIETTSSSNISNNAQQLLFQAFDWHYQQVNAGRPQTLFESEKVTTRLEAFVKTQVEKYRLWQDYYAYIAQLSNSGYQGIHFVNPNTARGTKYLLLHADKLWILLNRHSCEDKTVLEQVMLYLLASWSKSSGRCSISVKDRIEFIDSLRFQSLLWFNSRGLTSDAIGEFSAAEFDEGVRSQVSPEIISAIDGLMKNLGLRRDEIRPSRNANEAPAAPAAATEPESVRTAEPAGVTVVTGPEPVEVVQPVVVIEPELESVEVAEPASVTVASEPEPEPEPVEVVQPVVVSEPELEFVDSVEHAEEIEVPKEAAKVEEPKVEEPAVVAPVASPSDRSLSEAPSGTTLYNNNKGGKRNRKNKGKDADLAPKDPSPL